MDTKHYRSLREVLAECVEYMSNIPESAVGGDNYAANLARRARIALAYIPSPAQDSDSKAGIAA